MNRQVRDRKGTYKIESEMRQRDLFIEAPSLEALCTVERLERGVKAVRKNKGSPGIDGVTIAEFESHLAEERRQLKVELESGTYKPSPVRRVEIPKPGGKAPDYSECRLCATGWFMPR